MRDEDDLAAIVRTDFSDASAWAALKRTITAPVGPDGFLANVRFVDDRSNDGRSVEELVRGFGGPDARGILPGARAQRRSDAPWLTHRH